MSKHPHRLIFQQKRTWKCTLPGCTFFVHRGLQHVLIGKIAVCWECNEEFVIDEYALKDETPMCFDCRNAQPAPIEPEKPIETPRIQRTPEQQAMYEKLMREQFGKDWKKLLEGI